jgi:outer membrane protein assembly factor BamB
MRTRLAARWQAIAGWAVLAVAFLATNAQAASVYSAGGWPTLHADAGNRRAVDATVLDATYHPWHALAGAAVLTAPTTSPDSRQIVVTTGQAAGKSNLHAFSLDGELLWQAPPWTTASDGVDPCAILSSPIVDDRGDIFIGDCNQLFAFTGDGTLKWVIDLPPVQAQDWQPVENHPINALTTAAFTASGHLFGVTNFGDVIVVERQTGRILNHPYRLPGKIPPYSTVVPLPDSLYSEGLMDLRFREWVWQLIFGGNMRSANTPAVGANGRLFVVGSAERAGAGALYALDLVDEGSLLRIQEAFVTEIGLGSGSSPALSPDETQVYVSDEEGWFYGVDARSGAVNWKVQTRAAAGAAGVGPDGTIYALQGEAPPVIAISPEGRVLWESDVSELTRGLPSSWLLGEPRAAGNGNPTIVGDAILVPVIYGYYPRLIGTSLPLPVGSGVIAIDKRTGKGLREVVRLVDDSAGITAVLADGTIVSSLGAVLTSAMSPMKTLADWVLPGEQTLLEARGGIQVSRPQPIENAAP